MSVAEVSRRTSIRERLFVYGTLRKGGLAASYLGGQLLVEQNLRLEGFAMYDAGWYPFVVPAPQGAFIVGDVFEVERSLLPTLDKYEGEGYVKHFLEKEGLLLYLKADEEVEGFRKVQEGDWLSYWKSRNS